MTSFTLTFPSEDRFTSALSERAQRRAYIRGLAMLDDYTNEWDEARVGRNLFRYGLFGFDQFAQSAKSSGALSESLIHGAGLSSALKPVGHGDLELNQIALVGHLRISIRERILDLFGCVTSASSDRSYDRASFELRAQSRDVNRMLVSGFPEAIIRGALELDARGLEIAANVEPAPSTFSTVVTKFDPKGRTAYSHTNSKGVTYYLHATEVTLRGGKPQMIYFFAKVEFNAKGIPVSLPPDRVVRENPRNGFLTVIKKK